MILTEPQEYLKHYIKAPGWISKARQDHKTLKALITGEGFIDELVNKIEKLESQSRINARKAFSRSVKDTTEKLLRPLDNIYTATGGTKTFDIRESDKNRIISRLSKIRDNKSLRDWLKEHWIKDFLFTDPWGVVFLEYIENEKVYPTYKSIDNIRAYESRGQKIEWIIFEPKKFDYKTKDGQQKNAELYRIVDDKWDMTYQRDGDEFILIEERERTFDHPFGEVPALINSPITRPGSGERLSPANRIDETLKEFSRDQSILTLYKYTNLMPIFWRYGQLCPDCQGIGKIGEKICGTCNGSGYLKQKDITDEIILPLPDTDVEQGQKIAPDIAGFISPDLETAKYYKESLKESEVSMYETLWGSHKSKISQTTESRTATEVWLDTQPVMVRLNYYSEMAAYMEKQLTEWIANWTLPAKDKMKSILSLSYGTRFIIDPPDALLDKYNSNKEKGAPIVILDRQLHEYLTSKYQNDPGTLRMELIKKQLEPYVHFSLKEVNDVFGQGEAMRKALFTDWWETVQMQDIQSKKEAALEKDRDKYIEDHIINLKPKENGN